MRFPSLPRSPSPHPRCRSGRASAAHSGIRNFRRIATGTASQPRPTPRRFIPVRHLYTAPVAQASNADQTQMEQAVLAGARQVIRPLVLEHFTAYSCVATVRITIDVLAYFGIMAKPAAAQAMIFNAEAVNLMEAGATAQQLHDAVHAFTEQQEGGPWTIGLGFGLSETNDAGGHVVTWVPSVRTVLDYSLDQASRPHKGIALGPLDIPVPDAVASPSEPLPVGFVFSARVPQQEPYGAAYAEYRVAPDWFRSSPNWRRSSPSMASAPATFKEIAGTAIREIRHRL